MGIPIKVAIHQGARQVGMVTFRVRLHANQYHTEIKDA